ncbi:MAG TPA: DinB family protein [Chryseolinea sp.]
MNERQLFIKMALDAWNIQIDRTSKLFTSLPDDQLQQEVAPGRNTGVYLLGHLTAVHDALFPLLGLGERYYAELDEVFVKNPDKASLEKPPTKDLRRYWADVNGKLDNHFSSFTADQWFQKHAAISEEDFIKEPHRNKLNVVLNRTAHLANHLGQLTFLKK